MYSGLNRHEGTYLTHKCLIVLDTQYFFFILVCSVLFSRLFPLFMLIVCSISKSMNLSCFTRSKFWQWNPPPPLKFNLKNVWTSQQLLRFFYCECAELLLCIKIQNHLDENSFQNLWWWFTGWHVRSLIRAVKVEMMSTGWGSLSDPSQLQGWKKKKRKEKKEKRMFILTSRDESKSEYYCLGGIG